MNSALALPTSLLFIDNTKVGIPFAEFTKATPASENHAKSVTRLPDSTWLNLNWSRQTQCRLWTVLTKILKSAFGSPTSNFPVWPIKIFEVGIPFFDYEQCLYSFKVSIQLVDFHPSPVWPQQFGSRRSCCRLLSFVQPNVEFSTKVDIWWSQRLVCQLPTAQP